MMNRQLALRATYFPAGDYYAAGDVRRWGKARMYAGGYYPGGGFFSKLGNIAKKAMSNPLIQSAVGMVPGVGPLAVQGYNLLTAGKQAPAKNIQAFSGGVAGIMGGVGAGVATNKAVGAILKKSGGTPSVELPAFGQGMLLPKKKHRRMNPFNWKALKRADRRLYSFSKHVKHYVTVARQGHHGVKPKRGRRGHR